jgi:hypothetical protein
MRLTDPDTNDITDTDTLANVLRLAAERYRELRTEADQPGTMRIAANFAACAAWAERVAEECENGNLHLMVMVPRAGEDTLSFTDMLSVRMTERGVHGRCGGLVLDLLEDGL